MKKYYKYILVVFLSVMLGACVDDDKLFELSDFDKGALLNFSRTANDNGFIDVFDLAGSTMEFSADFKNDFEQDPDTNTPGSGRVDSNLEFAPVQSFDVEVRWRRASSGERSAGILSSGNTTWPMAFTYTPSDIAQVIEEIDTQEDFEVGDEVVISGTIHMQDGRVLPAFVPDANGLPVLAYSTSFPGQPGLNVSLTYNVSCGSDLASATIYDLEVVVTGTCCGLATETLTGRTATVSAGAGAGKYIISDILGGHLVPFSLDPEGAVVTDVCNVIIVDGTANTSFNGLQYMPNSDDGLGSYDPVTDTWIIKWEDGFGNGIKGVSTLTPQ